MNHLKVVWSSYPRVVDPLIYSIYLSSLHTCWVQSVNGHKPNNPHRWLMSLIALASLRRMGSVFSHLNCKWLTCILHQGSVRSERMNRCLWWRLRCFSFFSAAALEGLGSFWEIVFSDSSLLQKKAPLIHSDQRCCRSSSSSTQTLLVRGNKSVITKCTESNSNSIQDGHFNGRPDNQELPRAERLPKFIPIKILNWQSQLNIGFIYFIMDLFPSWASDCAHVLLAPAHQVPIQPLLDTWPP